MKGTDVRFIQVNLKESGFFTDRITSSFNQTTLDALNRFQKEIDADFDSTIDSKTWMKIILYNNKLKDAEKERIKKEEEELNLIEQEKSNIIEERKRDQLSKVLEKNKVIEERKRLLSEQKRLKSEEINNKLLEERRIYQQLEEEERLRKETIDKIFRIPSHIGEDDFRLYDYVLSDDSYNKEETRKETIYLHNTNSGPRPDLVIKNFNKNLKEANHFVIGRKSFDIEVDCDGKILKAFDDRYWAYCFNDKDFELNSKSISIQICNSGPLVIGEDGNYYNSSHQLISKDEVIELDSEFEGSKFWEKYTEAQIESLRKLITYLMRRWSIQLDGLNNNLFTQNEMIQMINNL
jgi:N-acetyl-anhydromuramyl-L-alanine amidase AmpD